MALTSKQKLFVKEYLVDKNAARAARAAGYSMKTAHAIGPENLTKLEIRSALSAEIKKQIDNVGITAERVLNEIGSLAFHDHKKIKNKLRAADKLKALELLAKHFKLLTDMTEVSGKNGEAVQVILTMPKNNSEAPDETI